MVFLCSAALTLRLHVPFSYMAVHRGSSFAFFLNLSAEDENPIASASCCLTASSQGRFDVLIVCQSLCLKIIQQQYLRICWKKNQVTSNSSPLKWLVSHFACGSWWRPATQGTFPLPLDNTLWTLFLLPCSFITVDECLAPHPVVALYVYKTHQANRRYRVEAFSSWAHFIINEGSLLEPVSLLVWWFHLVSWIPNPQKSFWDWQTQIGCDGLSNFIWSDRSSSTHLKPVLDHRS